MCTNDIIHTTLAANEDNQIAANANSVPSVASLVAQSKIDMAGDNVTMPKLDFS